MRKPRNYDSAETYTGGKKLPAGGYICKIINVKEETSKSGNDMLVLAFDICEGEFKDFYKEGYEKNTSENKKWRGNFYMMVPGEEAEANDWKLRRFKTNIGKFEDSNNGYHFDWEHPEKLLGLLVGMVFGEEEYIASDGSNRFSTKPVRLETVETIKDGDFEMPAVKYLDQNPNAKPSNDNNFVDIPDNVDGEQIPFNF